jgi:hypothetical protein
VAAFLYSELNEVLKQKAVADKFEAEGTTVVGGTPGEMTSCAPTSSAGRTSSRKPM